MVEAFMESRIVINVPAAKVWDALTNPEMTKHYMFGCEIVCDWKIGDSVLWKGAQDGVTYVKGYLVAFEKEKTLTMTAIDPNASYEDIPENHLTATYQLTENNNTTLLEVKQGDYTKVAEGAKRYKDTMSFGGWNTILESIKKLVEQGE